MASRAILLASASPRRADLLRGLELECSIVPSVIDETPFPGEAPRDLALRLARAKAVAAKPRGGETLVIAADTIVVVEGRVLGKPSGRDEAVRYLTLLAGRTHSVITGLAVRAWPEEDLTVETAESRVTFAPMSDAMIGWYASTGEGLDKAGAYALQGKGALFIAAVEGSYTNVIGLPLERLHPHLRRWRILP